MKKKNLQFIRPLIPRKGFVLPFTMLMAVLILFVTMGSMTLLSKQLYFSRLYKDSQLAYYAADDAVTCTVTIDDTYVGSDGLGIFPHASSTNPVTADGDGNPSYGYITDVLAAVNTKRALDAANKVPPEPAPPDIVLNTIKCGQALIFDTSPVSSSQFSVSPTDYEYHYTDPISGLPAVEFGLTSTFLMRMDLGVDPVTMIRMYRCARVTVNKTPSFRQIIAQGYSVCDSQSAAIERAVVNTTISN